VGKSGIEVKKNISFAFVTFCLHALLTE